jgi:hypothetical protein
MLVQKKQQLRASERLKERKKTSFSLSDQGIKRSHARYISVPEEILVSNKKRHRAEPFIEAF